MTDSKAHGFITGAIVVLLFLPASAFSEDIQRRIWTYDFAASESSAEIVRNLMTDFRPVTCGKVSKQAIYQHAGILGDDLVEVRFSNVPIPARVKGVQGIYLHFYTGIEDGDAFGTEHGVDGCQFIIRINGKQVFSIRRSTQKWAQHRINLARYAGKEVDIHFLIDPIRSSTADWAAWGRPRVYIEGTGEFLDALAETLGQTAPADGPLPIKGPHRITRINKDDKSVTLLAVLDATLDEDTQFLNAEPAETGKDRIGHRLVAGQGQGADNHTIVRILSEYGTTEMQFMAYPLYVKGGVQVQAGKDNLGYTRIVAAPLSDAETCFIRVFNEHGGFVRDIPVRSDLSAPFVVDVGNYDPERPGDEIAITSRRQKAGCPMKILFYGIDGGYITYRQLPIETDAIVKMATQTGNDADALYMYFEKTARISVLESMEGTLSEIENSPAGFIQNVDSKGTFDDTVFETPFANRIDVQHLTTYGVNSENVKDYRIGPLNDLKAGVVIEITCKAKTDSDGRMTLGIYQGRTLLDGLRQVFAPPVDTWKHYRFVFRIQRPAEDITLRLQTDHKIQLEDFNVTRQSELNVPSENEPVTFDILE